MSLDTEQARKLFEMLKWRRTDPLLEALAELIVNLSARVDGLCATERMRWGRARDTLLGPGRIEDRNEFDVWANEGDWSYHWDSALGRGRRHDVTGELEWWEDRQ